jgi:hypothetical protein
MALATSVWRAAWRSAVILYGMVNVGGVPDALEGWKDFLQPFGDQASRILGIGLLALIFLSLGPKDWRAFLLRPIRRLLPDRTERGMSGQRRRMTTDERRAAEKAEASRAQEPPIRRPGGSFIIEAKRVRNSHILNSKSNHPESLGRITGEDEVEGSTMEGNVHTPRPGSGGRAVMDLSGAESAENIFIEGASVQYTDGPPGD